MNCPVIILGAGGHSRVLIEALHLLRVVVLGSTDLNPEKNGRSILGVTVIGDDDVIAKHSPAEIFLVNGLGSVRVNHHRGDIFERFKNDGYQFSTVIHPSAVIASNVVWSEGVQIMAGAVLQAGCRIGANTIINTCAVVEHDCQIGNHTHVASGAVISGGVHIGEYVHIGAGATVIQEVRIGANSLVGAGAVVIRDVPENTAVAGVPAKEINP